MSITTTTRYLEVYLFFLYSLSPHSICAVLSESVSTFLDLNLYSYVYLVLLLLVVLAAIHEADGRLVAARDSARELLRKLFGDFHMAERVAQNKVPTHKETYQGSVAIISLLQVRTVSINITFKS